MFRFARNHGRQVQTNFKVEQKSARLVHCADGHGQEREFKVRDPEGTLAYSCSLRGHWYLICISGLPVGPRLLLLLLAIFAGSVSSNVPRVLHAQSWEWGEG